MTDAATVVWLLEAPSPGAKESLDDWARARGLHLVSPSEGGLSGRFVDLGLAGAIEADVARARDALAKADLAAAEASLSHAEHELLAHPELPQAAWLLAEVERGWSTRWARLEPRSEERAREAWIRARALDGGRAPGVGESSFETSDPPVPFTLAADVPKGARVALDGDEVAAGSRTASAGEHQLLVDLGGHLLFASWVSIARDIVVDVHVAGAAACSREDLGRVHGAASGVVSATGVACERWLAVTPTTDGVAVASCVREACSTPVEWRTLPLSAQTPSVAAHGGGWPVWATWTAVGLAALAGVGVTLAATGALGGGSQSSRFVQGGVKTETAPRP